MLKISKFWACSAKELISLGKHCNGRSRYISNAILSKETKLQLMKQVLASNLGVSDAVPALYDRSPTRASRCFCRSFQTCSALSAKKSKTQKLSGEEAGDEELLGLEDDEAELMKGDKDLTVRLSSDRLDAVMKVGFQMSRNKIEKALYSDLIRVNGVRPRKKSMLVGEGDEIDYILRYNRANPIYLDVHRLNILYLGQYSRTEDEDSDDEAKIPAKIRQSKNLTIENYAAPFKGNIDSL